MMLQLNHPRQSSPQLRLMIPHRCWRQMWSLAIACPTEVNGFGYIELLANGVFNLREVFILEQIATAWSVRTKDEVLHAHLEKMREQRIPSEWLRFQWHSHCDGQSFFSMTDQQNIERWPGDWLVSLVLNRQGEVCCRFDQFGETRLALDVMPILVHLRPTPGELRWASEQLATAVWPDPLATLQVPAKPTEKDEEEHG